jgi:Tfp pilus assembly protein PilF
MTTGTQPAPKTQNTPISLQEMPEMVKKGTDALESGDIMAALEAFEQVVRSYPDRPEGHNNLGAMYSAMGENTKAESCFDQVLSILPGNPDVHYNRGVVRSRQENFDTAREDFMVVLLANPNDTDTMNNLGVMDFMQGHLETARNHFHNALQENPAYSNALLNLVDVEQSSGNLAQAVLLCENFLQDNNSLEVRRKLLDLLSSGCTEALEKASRIAETLIGTDGDNSDTRLKLGRLIQARSVLTAQAG